MRVLMISPHPTYSPRGTPISVLNRCQALSRLGHQVDLVTYGIGEDVPVPGLSYLRAPVPGITSVRVGPSLRKLPLDLAVFVKSGWILLTRRSRYDVLHTHEEAGVVGLLLARAAGIPHVYDMGNDLDVVLGNYGLGARNPLRTAARLLESAIIRSATLVLAHFDSLRERVESVPGERACQVVYNVPIGSAPDPHLVEVYRKAWSREDLPTVLYTGTLERYQGLDLLVEAARMGRGHYQVVLVGGTDDQQRDLEGRCVAEDITNVYVHGAVPGGDVASCLAAADVLVSPRATGTNTPLKIFEYLHSGVPIVATRIASHTGVLDDTTAELVEPTPAGLHAGIMATLSDPVASAMRATAAAGVAHSRYSEDAYVAAVAAGYAALANPSAHPCDTPRIGQ